LYDKVDADFQMPSQPEVIVEGGSPVDLNSPF
jgi:hypothetical protein